MIAQNHIAIKLKELKSELKTAHLVAVTKYSPVEDVEAAYHFSQLDFGENRVSDLKEKSMYFYNKKLDEVRWHFIGHLQTNKVKELLSIPNLYSIHSVDSIRLLEEILKRENEFKASELKIFFQVNTSHEDEKSGFLNKEELYQAIKLLLSKTDSKCKFYGLMTMGTIRTEAVEKEAERCFSLLNKLKTDVQTDFKLNELHLSMGMSNDYKIALLHGADFIRIGSMIFKE